MLSVIFGHMCCIHHLHISHNAPYLPPKILHNLCFSFLLGITAVPTEIQNYNAYAKVFGRQIRCIMGDVQVAYNTSYKLFGVYLCTETYLLRFAENRQWMQGGDLQVLTQRCAVNCKSMKFNILCFLSLLLQHKLLKTVLTV